MSHQTFYCFLVLQFSLHVEAAQGEEDAAASLLLGSFGKCCHIANAFSSLAFPFPVASHVHLFQQSTGTEIAIGFVNVWEAFWSLHWTLCTPVSLCLVLRKPVPSMSVCGDGGGTTN